MAGCSARLFDTVNAAFAELDADRTLPPPSTFRRRDAGDRSGQASVA